MTGFAIGAAALLALSAWLLRAAWRPLPSPASTEPANLVVLREQFVALDRDRASGQIDATQFAAARNELQRRALDESAAESPDAPGPDADAGGRPLWSVVVGVPVFAAALYSAIGNPAAWNVEPPANAISASTSASSDPEVSNDAMQALLARLAAQLEKAPPGDPATDLQGWTMLARSYAALQRFADADRAYARAIALAPRDAQLLADRADVLVAAQGARAAGEADRLVAQALQIDPDNLKALALAGTAAFERRDFEGARRHWQRARDLAPPHGAFAAGLDRSLAEAGAPVPAAASTPVPAATGPARITGSVELAAALRAQVAPGDTVFVFARAVDGPRMPLAIVRRRAAELPFDFALDDSLAMSPQSRLSGVARVVVGARISRSGSATPQPGDLRGESGPVAVGSGGLRLTIDSVLP